MFCSQEPTALYTAVTAVDWSADGTQIASVERGGMSRIFMLVPAAKPGEKEIDLVSEHPIVTVHPGALPQPVARGLCKQTG